MFSQQEQAHRRERWGWQESRKSHNSGRRADSTWGTAAEAQGQATLDGGELSDCAATACDKVRSMASVAIAVGKTSLQDHWVAECPRRSHGRRQS